MNKATVPPEAIAGVGEDLTTCSYCGAPTQLDHGTCINCLLREGLETKGEGSREAFESVLVEDDVTDTEWRLGHYEILEEIGRGGMGVIYRARQQHSRRIVAVKRILAHQVNSHETLVRFRREAEAVASLDHPNILPIHEVSESEEGLPYFSMKYAMGGSLRAAAPTLRKNPRGCVRLMAKVGRAIDYAHSKGILHRDLQPGNILLDENGEPMVSDFGLAKWLDQGSDLTKTLETLGTPGYIAPEQAERPADKLTRAADVYSLGAIGFYLLTGRPPFVGSNVLHVIHQAAATPAPRLRSLAPSLDRDLETIVGRCLESDPNGRYQSAGALADDLEHWLRHEPIRARRTGIFTRGRKWVRRNPTSTVLVASLIALAAAIGVMFWERGSIHPVATGNESIPYKSVAVLPFENLSADAENAFFADGVQDEILNNLAKIADLKVISRTSVMQYKSGAKRNLRQIANELGVAHVVEGSVQRVANRVRVSAQLIDAKSDTHSWANSYDRPLDDVFAIQSDIAKAIAAQLQAKLSPAEQTAIEKPATTNHIAYDRYLRAKKLFAQQTTQPLKDIREMVRLLDQAIANDPTFLLAHCELAHTHAYLYFLGYDHTPARIALAEQARNAALRLGPERGEPHLAAAYVAYWCYQNYEAALAEVDIARHGLPNNESVFSLPAYIARRQGHWEQCMRNLERAIELDPRNYRLLGDAGFTYEYERRFPEAAAYWDRAVALAPDDPTVAVLRARLDLESRADARPRYEAIQSVLAKDPSLVDRIADQWFDVALCRRDAAEMASALASLPPEGTYGVPRSFSEGLAARVQNDATAAEKAFTAARVEVQKVVHEQPDYAQALSTLGMIDAALGHKEDALREGRRAVELLPLTKDAMTGADLLTNLAIIYTWVGEKDLAIKQLQEVLQVPGPACYGRLRLDPSWDPLRGDPRFEKLLEESKKPVALESTRPLPAGVAVLPFENLSADPENAFFADGVQDEILNNMAKIADLKVISRTSVMQYKSGVKRNLRQIANELGVAHVIEGSVQRAANRVRVSAQLIDAKTDAHLWANSYDRPLGDVFAIQTNIAKAIAAQLKAKLSPAEKSAIEQPPTTNLIAYDRYLRARKLGASQTGRVPGDMREVIRLLDQAVAYDPTFVLAYCDLARAHAYAYHLGVDRTPARVALAKTARDAALRLGPDRGEPHLAAADVAFHCDLDYETALSEVAIARDKLPNDGSVFALTAYIHRRQGHWENCASDLERAVQLDPRNVWLLQDAAETYHHARQFPEAAVAWDRVLAVAPGDASTRVWRALVDLDSEADAQPAQEAIQNIVTEDPSAVDLIAELWLYLALCRRDAAEVTQALASLPPDGIVRRDLLMPRSFCAGLAARARGDMTGARTGFTAARAEMEKVVREQPDYAQARCVLGMSDAALGRKEDAIREGRRAVELLPVTKDMMAGAVVLANLAIIYAWAGEKDLALEQLATAIRFPSSEFLSYGQLKLHPFWDPLRGDPRFEKLVEESKKPVALNTL
jgi:TolB-like protein/Flp pilus assembly protein TadD/tRNA A-37 threonylcarbamoyl transferase component Bud32